METPGRGGWAGGGKVVSWIKVRGGMQHGQARGDKCRGAGGSSRGSLIRQSCTVDSQEVTRGGTKGLGMLDSPAEGATSGLYAGQ